jgi:hypothetical protein
MAKKPVEPEVKKISLFLKVKTIPKLKKAAKEEELSMTAMGATLIEEGLKRRAS